MVQGCLAIVAGCGIRLGPFFSRFFAPRLLQVPQISEPSTGIIEKPKMYQWSYFPHFVGGPSPKKRVEWASRIFFSSLNNYIIFLPEGTNPLCKPLRKLQHIPGTYPRRPPVLWLSFLYFGVPPGYVPGVCWNLFSPRWPCWWLAGKSSDFLMRYMNSNGLGFSASHLSFPLGLGLNSTLTYKMYAGGNPSLFKMTSLFAGKEEHVIYANTSAKKTKQPQMSTEEKNLVVQVV